MADGPLPSPNQGKKKKGKKSGGGGGAVTAAESSSHNGNVVLGNSVDVVNRELKSKNEEEEMTSSENQIVIRDALRLQRDLLQLNLAVPVKLKLVEKSIRDFRGFYSAAHEQRQEESENEEEDDEASSKDKNGDDATHQSILSLLESVATSAAVYAKQLRDSTPRHRDSSSSSPSLSQPDSTSNKQNAQEKREARRALRRQKRQEKIDKLLERVSQTPIELMFGVRIRRKYAEEVAKRYGLEPQPYYADLSDSDSLGSCSSPATSSDESLLADNKIGINSTRINGVNAKVAVVDEKKQEKAKGLGNNGGLALSPASNGSNNKKSPTLAQSSPLDQQKVTKKPTSMSMSTKPIPNLPVLRRPVGKSKKGKSENEALDMLNWMDRLRMEMENEQSEQVHQQKQKLGMATGKFKNPQSSDNTGIPPEAMEILKEALVSAAQNQTDEHLNEETARVLATNFIQATAASAAASRLNQGSSSTDTMPSSSSANTEIPGLSQDAAVEVWKEIQQYLRNLCLSNTAAQELAAKTAESLKGGTSGKGKPKTPPLPPASQMKPLPDFTTQPTTKADKRKKRKTKSVQASPYPESVLERRRELLRLQAEKQQEHAMVVAQLREQEAKLREAVAAAASAQRSWINYKPVEIHPYKVGSGPYGAVYQHEDFSITCHSEWMDGRMIARGLRVYILIRALERHRLYDHCDVRRREARFCLFLHCDKFRDGFLTYLSSGDDIKALKEVAASSGEKDDFDATDIAFYETHCSHIPKWSKIEWKRMQAYHKQFYGIDKKLPMLPGDFYFLMNQLHMAYEENNQYAHFRYRQQLKFRRHLPRCDCEQCVWERRHIYDTTIPTSLPFDPLKHNVELYLPTNYVLQRPVAEQRRLLKNQAQLAEKCLVILKKPIADEERRYMKSGRGSQPPSNQPKNQGKVQSPGVAQIPGIGQGVIPGKIQNPFGQESNPVGQKLSPDLSDIPFIDKENDEKKVEAPVTKQPAGKKKKKRK